MKFDDLKQLTITLYSYLIQTMIKFITKIVLILFFSQSFIQTKHISDTSQPDFEPDPIQSVQERVVDFFKYDGQDELLQNKLQATGDYVDYFVIFEGVYNFDGSLKGLSFDKLNFVKHSTKIVYLPIRNFPHIGSNLTSTQISKNQNYFYESFGIFVNFFLAEKMIVILSEIDQVLQKDEIINFKNSSSDQKCVKITHSTTQKIQKQAKLLKFTKSKGIDKRFLKALFSRSCKNMHSDYLKSDSTYQSKMVSPVKSNAKDLINAKKRIVVQCNPFNGQQNILSLKLEIQKQFVDYYILTESPYSHTGILKGLEFNASIFGEHAQKLIYLPLLNFPYVYQGKDLTFKQRWANQFFMRNQAALFLKVFLQPEDIIIVGDLDQIISKQGFQQFQPENDVIVQTQLRLFYFYFNRRSVFDSYKKGVLNYMYAGSEILLYKNFKLLFLQSLDFVRNNACKNWDKSIDYKLFCPNKVIRLAGWHFSYVLDDAGVIKKLRSFADSTTSKIKTPNFTEVRLSGVLQNCYPKDFDLFNAHLPEVLINDVIKYKQKSQYAQYLVGIDFSSLNYDQKTLQLLKLKGRYAELATWMEEQHKLLGRRQMFVAQVYYFAWFILPYLGVIIGGVLLLLVVIFCRSKCCRKCRNENEKDKTSYVQIEQKY